MNPTKIAAADLFFGLREAMTWTGDIYANMAISGLIEALSKISGSSVPRVDHLSQASDSLKIVYKEAKEKFDLWKPENIGMATSEKPEVLLTNFQFVPTLANEAKGKKSAIPYYSNDAWMDGGGGAAGAVNTAGSAYYNSSSEERNKLVPQTNGGTYPHWKQFWQQNEAFHKDVNKFSDHYNIKVNYFTQIIKNAGQRSGSDEIKADIITYATDSGYSKNEVLEGRFFDLLQKMTMKQNPLSKFLGERNSEAKHQKATRYYYVLLQSLILAINNNVEYYYMGGLAGTGAFTFFKTVFGESNKLSELINAFGPLLETLRYQLAKSKTKVILGPFSGGSDFSEAHRKQFKTQFGSSLSIRDIR